MERRAITVRGIVQGVGYRPFVFGLAQRCEVGGWVRNQAGEVVIEAEGERMNLDRFCEALDRDAPPLARAEEVTWRAIETTGERVFRINASDEQSTGEIRISADVAVCEDCLAEMRNPTDRRYRYPFINCTNCGPRLTIITGAPYDRPRTTMAEFAMCADCRSEYDDPGNRRFHAQPIACPTCGPQLSFADQHGEQATADEALACFARAIKDGRIGAMKGLGGYHLVCDATNEQAVATLRQRKNREEKPLAVMMRDVDQVRGYAMVGAAEAVVLEAMARPIVLLRRRQNKVIAASVAPGHPMLGVMLPYTPLHVLLMDAVGGRPLVMTSGNRSDEPIAYEDEDARARLGGIADVFLSHNRPIHVRCDDSVVQVVNEKVISMRRSRGYAPQAMGLPMACGKPMLAVGGQLKNVFALGDGASAILSQHIGDLDHVEAYRAFERDVRLYERLFAVKSEVIVHDMHPAYASTRYALRRAKDEGLLCVPVQHHHAHMAACMAEHGLMQPVIGVSFDGTGYGTDGAIWGGEFLVGDYGKFQRTAHLRYVAMPGGDQAIRQPWRMAVAHLLDAGVGERLLSGRVDAASLGIVRQMIERGFNCPMTSSAGRLFDAVAAIIGLRDQVSYEGQAAVELQWLATGIEDGERYPLEEVADKGSQAVWKMGDADEAKAAYVIDTRPMVRAIVRDVAAGVASAVIARRFHSAIVHMTVTVCQRVRETMGINTVVLSGGVFCNAIVMEEVVVQPTRDGFDCRSHHCVPPGDGGLALGQIAIASAMLVNC